jgi:STE24 endopeptidase
MQILVFIAFAVVLWLPDEPQQPFRPLMGMGRWPVAVVVGLAYPVVIAAVSVIASRLVIRQLDDRPPRPLKGQQVYSGASLLVRILIVLGLAVQVLLTGWVPLVRERWGLSAYYGLDEIVILAPFLAAQIASWVFLYAADRAIRHLVFEARLLEAAPVHPIWTLRQFLIFNLRHQLLVVLVPMVIIIVAYDATRANAAWLKRTFGVQWADMCWIWHTIALPAGALRSRLTQLCRRIGLRYRRIMIWRSQGLVVNAAVTGLVPQLRYVLLSDGLIESLDDEKIEAVFGHEAGHIKHHHIFFFLNFAILSMLIAGGIMELVAIRWPAFLQTGYGNLLMGTLLGAIWLLGFGWISRRFERQADLYGARITGDSVHECRNPCSVHPASPVDRAPRHAVCTTAAANFCEALEEIAILNGIPIHARSWRHSSIASRIAHLRKLAAEPAAAVRFERIVTAIKVTLFVGMVIGLSFAAYLYWPYLTGR